MDSWQWREATQQVQDAMITSPQLWQFLLLAGVCRWLRLRIVIFMFWRCISILIRPELTGNLIRFSVRVFITQIADHAAEPSAYSFAILTSMYILYIHWLQNSAQTKLANYIPLGWSNMWNTYVSSYLGPCSNCFVILILLSRQSSYRGNPVRIPTGDAAILCVFGVGKVFSLG